MEQDIFFDRGHLNFDNLESDIRNGLIINPEIKYTFK